MLLGSIAGLGREAERRGLRRHLALHRPRLDGNHAHLPRHDERGESHGHGQGEHGVQLVVDHCVDHVPGLGEG